MKARRRLGRTNDISSVQNCSRRTLLTLAGMTVTTAGLAGCSSSDSMSEHGWKDVNSPTEKDLYDVVMTTKGPLAVGESGRVLTRRETDWTVPVEDGPADAQNSLVAAAATDNRQSVWFCGSSGAIGRYNIESQQITDYSAPKGKTSSWESVAVTGPAGQERIYLLNGSGELLPGQNQNGDVSWGEVRKPGGGLSLSEITYVNQTGYICDDNGNVYRTTDTDHWNIVGIDEESSTLHDLVELDAETVTIVGENGLIFHYDGYNWLTVNASEDALHAVDRVDGRGIAAGVNGAVYSLTGNEWTGQDVPASTTFHGAALGSTNYSDVVVGNEGTVLERFR